MFVQISDENLHHVREVMDEVFGEDNLIAIITFVTTTGSTSEFIGKQADYLLFYAKNRAKVKFRTIYKSKPSAGDDRSAYSWLSSPQNE